MKISWASITQTVQRLQPGIIFTEREAWDYFRLIAFGEALGWTLLITGILIHTFLTPHNLYAIDILGQLHGTLFIIYCVGIVVLASSMRWSRRDTLIAAMASIPPFGTLLLEQVLAYRRRLNLEPTKRQIVVRALITNGSQLLAIQPKDSGFWCLPGGVIEAGESMEQALSRLLHTQTGVRPQKSSLAYIFQYRHRGSDRLEAIFRIHDHRPYLRLDYKELTKEASIFDEIQYINPQTTAAFEPRILLDQSDLFEDKQASTVILNT